MEKNFENVFNVLYENNSTSNYLVLRTDNHDCLLNYQTQMLLNNKISGLLEFNINYIGEEINCFYNITSKCTLTGFMSRKRFSRNEFLVVILNIINNIGNLKNHLLYDNNILLDEKFIFVEPEKIEISFIYLPFTCYKNDIKAFLLKLIVELVNFYDEESDNYIQKLLEAIKDELFSLSSLKALIKNLLSEDIKNHNLSVSETVMEKSCQPKVNTKEKPIEKSIERSVKIPETAVNKKIKNIQKNISKNPDKSKAGTETKGKLKPWIFYLFQPVLLILFFLVVRGGNIVKDAENPRLTVIIFIIILISIDVLVFRLLKEKMNTVDKEKMNGALNTILSKMKASSTPAIIEKPAVMITKKEVLPPALRKKHIGETEIIKKAELKKVPCLKERDGDLIIELSRKSMLIGRMENFVDYVISNSAIGKIHAEILDEDGAFYVMDCNSRNGTFLNDNRILPNTKSRLCNNDIIRFANKEFVFTC